MFSGIVETIGSILTIVQLDGCKQFCIMPQMSFNDLKIGDSVSVNGVCLTVTEVTDDYFFATAISETLSLTNLNTLTTDHQVNLERAITPLTRIGGHYMQGHIDSTAKILAIQHTNLSERLMTIEIPAPFARYVVKKGYIGIDGMSLTIADEIENRITVALIPQTYDSTIVKYYHVNHMVNIEVDIFGKYIHKQLEAYICQK